jgi:hypothetical protein
MSTALPLLLWLANVLGSGSGCDAPVGFLYQPAYCVDEVLRPPVTPYVPQPGDLLFCTDYTIFWTVTHDWAGAGHPHHSGIVVARPDGRLAALEAGPYDTLHIRICDLGPHFERYTEMGEPIWVRRRKTPLTCEQSARLTAFALAQEGKHFALIRQGAQLTPLRCRGEWRTYWMGGPHLDRVSYFCSELATNALVAACLLDPADARPSATYPSDLFFDHSANRFLNEHLNLSADWYPPARWLDCPWPGPGGPAVGDTQSR